MYSSASTRLNWLLPYTTALLITACTSTLKPQDFAVRKYSGIDDFVARRVLAGKEYSSPYWKPTRVKAHGIQGAIGGITQINYNAPYTEFKAFCESQGGEFVRDSALSVIASDERLLGNFLLDVAVNSRMLPKHIWYQHNQKNHFGTFLCSTKSDYLWSLFLLPLEYSEADPAIVQNKIETLRIAVLYGEEKPSAIIDRFVKQQQRMADLAAERARQEHQRRLLNMPLVKTIGARVCRSIPVHLDRSGFFTRSADPAKIQITGFTEQVNGEKVQIRINKIDVPQGTKLDKDRLSIDFRNADIVWGDAMDWEPCKR